MEVIENPIYLREKKALSTFEGLVEVAEGDPMYISQLLSRVMWEEPRYTNSYYIMFFLGQVYAACAMAPNERRSFLGSLKVLNTWLLKEKVTKYVGSKRLHGR